jgi:type III restriction enzyme
MVEKYRNKVIIRYDLVQFRNDRYSKDVVIVQSDFGLGERILQALILSQYKKEVAAKYRINLKPVILFKAQRTIAQSQENKASFHRLIEGLTARDIENIRRKSDIGLVRRAFAFFDAQGITSAQLAERLKHDFKEDFCLSVNDDKEKEKYQILLNTLEDKNNRVRAIFSVQKLSEGWDVLNLFDIVRCYESRDSGRAKLGSATISEAQLIGRGARYFPFTVPENDDRFRRKFDGDLEHELRMLEELHYHSINDSRYILEIRAALIERGMMDDRTVERKMMLKDSFKKSRFYLEGPIFVNSRQRKDYQRITSLSALGVSTRNITHVISSGHGGENRVLAGERQRPLIMEEISKDVRVKDIGYHLIYSALARNPFFTFGSLRKYFPRLDSMRTFITSQDYLGGLEITFRGNIYKLEEDKADVMVAVTELLKQIEKEILGQITEYEGATEFGRKPVCLVFKDKTLKLDKTSERGRDDEQFEHFISGKDWFAFNTLYGTSEEKAFVRMLDRQMERLRVEYDTIYLLRNEGHFAIYNFRDGQAFQPDFVLFLRKKGGEMLAYQLFIEPKGKFIQKYDKWKEDFLRELTEKCADMLKIDGDAKYRLIGVPFYNNEEENEFRKSLEGALNEPSRGNGNHSNRGNPPKELSLAPGKKS